MSTVHDSSARRRGQRLWVLLRPALTGVALLVVYYTMPLNRDGSLPALLVGLGALGALVAWQIRAVTTSPSPRLRAIEALATSIPLYIVLFAASYVTTSIWDSGAFTEAMDRTDALYFTITTLATVGFGDITPVSQAARIAVTVQMVTGLILLGLVIKAFLGAVQIGLKNSADSRGGHAEADEPRHGGDEGGPAGADGPAPGDGDPSDSGPAGR
ncbi:potassium channel family protein [Arthrobacter sulfonylureivorans]|uniref:Potassium channel family protein n=1 Tax=Arthrobacter sulfonylureivorans TaxID=2486855 RepID=A0ABY3W793_9MICC|nr:potassium channel family protein [Arthrobacter sulfonylureivorans]UNK46184.1 potassium channel family protein [Arthrobacter sulfonylureivorans]